MLLTIAEFRRRVSAHLPKLVAELQSATGRSSPEEAAAWAASLPVVSEAFQAPFFQPLQLYFGARGGICLEYRLPASSAWCDMVLLGAHDGRPSVAILELKHWEMTGDLSGPSDRLIWRHNGLQLHPSDQVRGYVEYCRNFHSAVLARNAQAHGCVLFTKEIASPTYRAVPYQQLIKEYPCFSAMEDMDRQRLAEYFASRLNAPDPQFADDFISGWYDQNRSFVRGIADTIASSTERPLVLLDKQRFGYAATKAEIEHATNDGGGKRVIIVMGPPGSGKSIIAAKIWADVAINSGGRVVLTSTSRAQETNWRRLFQTASGHHGAGGVVMPANKYAPASLRDLGSWMTQSHGAIGKPAQWRENLEWLKQNGKEFLMPDDHILVSVVDEAHALINPEHPRAITNSGWPNNLGPQAYHIIRASRISVFFLDPRQGFRERESTTVEEIEAWAHEFRVREVAHISLEGTQFRCAGSVEYVEWIDALLDGRDSATCAQMAKRFELQPLAPTGGGFSVQVCDSPLALEQQLRSKVEEGATARLVSSFSRPWKTEGQQQPHDLSPGDQDFSFGWRDAGRRHVWSRPWNVAPLGDYSHFVQGVPGTRIELDPLAEVGCTYAVRGFDFDYIGLLWLEDLTWDGNRWAINLDAVHESGIHATLRSAKRKHDPDPRDRQAVLDSVMRAYRILMTRAMKGVFLWCADSRTRDHLRASLGD